MIVFIKNRFIEVEKMNRFVSVDRKKKLRKENVYRLSIFAILFVKNYLYVKRHVFCIF